MKEFHMQLINADVVEMLCEASCTTNIILLKYIFKCLFIFIECSQFFQQNRSAYTLESVIRALYILVKTEDEKKTLIIGLKLVCEIICRLNVQKIPLNTVCNIPSIISLGRQLFDKGHKKLTVYVGTEVIISLLYSMGIQKFQKIMEGAVSESLKVLVEIAQKSRDQKCMIIISELVNGSMRFLVYPEIEVAVDISKSNIFLQNFMAMKEILAPFLIEHQDLFDENNLGMVRIILSALLTIYHYPENSITEEFSHFLVAKGFLIFLPSIEEQSNEMELIVVTRSLLFELLLCLSNSVLGRENWKKLLLPGFEAFCSGASYKSILYHDSNEILPIASIVFNYFYLISSSNPIVDREFLKTLTCYILSLSGVPPPSIMKAVWFLFAGSQLYEGICDLSQIHS